MISDREFEKRKKRHPQRSGDALRVHAIDLPTTFDPPIYGRRLHPDLSGKPVLSSPLFSEDIADLRTGVARRGFRHGYTVLPIGNHVKFNYRYG